MIRVFEAFAGYGSQRMALDNLGIEHEVVAISEIDKFAIKSYEAIHGETNNLGDISKIKVEDIPDHDLFTYSFPCQDISVAGKQEGFNKGSGTRSGLLWECERVITNKKPKYLLMENVKNLVGKKFMAGFQEWIDYLESVGYTNYWEVLNAKDFGIPQNRERVFMVSILGEHEPFEFPKPTKLEKRLKDVLQHEVDEKYYLSNERSKQLISTITDKNDLNEPTVVDASINEPKVKEVMNTITARYDAGIQNFRSIGGAVIEPERILGIFDKENSTHQAGSVYNKDKIAPTLDTMQGGWRQPSIIVESKIAASRGRNKENPSDRTKGIELEQTLEVNENGTSNALTTVQKDNYVVEPCIVDHLYKSRPPRVYKEHSPTLRQNSGGLDVAEPTSHGVLMSDIQEKMMLTDDELEYGVLKQELFDKFGTSRVCNRCKNQVLCSDLPNYNYLCFECDENLFTFETESAHFLIGSTQKNAGITDGDYSTTLTSAMGSGGGHVPMHNLTSNYRIRKLTPLECWRLMGVKDELFYKAQEVNSNTQLYKQAGNSIVVQVLERIFEKMFKEDHNA